MAALGDLALQLGGADDGGKSSHGAEILGEVMSSSELLLIAVAADDTRFEADDLIPTRAPELERRFEIFQRSEDLCHRSGESDMVVKSVLELTHVVVVVQNRFSLDFGPDEEAGRESGRRLAAFEARRFTAYRL